jgi:hypothetical protein
MQTWTDFNVPRWIENFGDIGLHTFTHFTDNTTPAPTWSLEEATDYKNLQALGKLPKTIVGSRAPYLKPNDAYFAEILNNEHIQYDSSMVQMQGNGVNAYWPFTLDYGIPDPNMCVMTTTCPVNTYPGLWEFPMTSPDPTNVFNVMDPVINNYKTLMTTFKNNFIASYNYNKAPRGIYWHWRYLSTDGNFAALNTTKAQFLTDFLVWITKTYPDIIFANERDIITWMKNPVSTTATKQMSQFQCTNSATISAHSACIEGSVTCVYGYDQIEVCGTQCPDHWPGRGVTWNYISPTNPGTVNSGLTHWTSDSFTFVDNGGCIDVYVTSSHQIAGAYLFTAQVCDSYATIDPGALWSNNFVAFNKPMTYGANINGFRQIAGNNPDPILYQNPTVYLDGNSINVASFCMATYAGFDDTVHMRFGIDFYAGGLDCEAGACQAFCGDGVCQTSTETPANCPVDCHALNCTAFVNPYGSNQWLGTATITQTSDTTTLRSKTHTVCGSIYVQNTGILTATSATLTFKICGSTSITLKTWTNANPYSYASLSTNPLTYRQVAHSLSYPAGNLVYKTADFCFTVPNAINIGNFDASVQFDNLGGTCTAKTCAPICGNNNCDPTEDATNCPADCGNC